MAGSFLLIRGDRYEIEEGKPVTIIKPEFNIIIKDTVIGEGTLIWSNVNIYGAHIGKNVKIGAFVEIRKGVKIGNNVKIEPYVFLPEGVTVEDCVFIGPAVIFTNDVLPRACDGKGQQIVEYEITPTLVKKGASIGAASAIRCGITIGEGALIGMGSVVVDDVPAGAVVYGQKAAVRRYLK